MGSVSLVPPEGESPFDGTVNTLTGGQTQYGAAIDNTQTDAFRVFGAGNTIYELHGNLLVSGASGEDFGYSWDSGTTITLGGTGVYDGIVLDGGSNVLQGTLSGAVVSYTVSGHSGTAGGNTVNLKNTGGFTYLTLGGSNNSVQVQQGAATMVQIGGSGNQVALNGNAANKVTIGGDSSVVFIGGADDDLFGYASSVALTGDANVVLGGDENFTIAGGVNSNSILLGDGTNSVTLSGTQNIVVVGGGSNFINAGGSGAQVFIQGIDGANPATFVPETDDTPAVTAAPSDTVVLAGAGDVVTATYENVSVLGANTTGGASVTLGNGNNNVSLGGTGGNTVAMGNGGNGVNVAGDNNQITVGHGANGVTFSGNANSLLVNDATGVGTDVVQLGQGTGDAVNLGLAGGSVTGWGPAGTAATVFQGGTRDVTVNLHGASGVVLLGDGNDSVTANGDDASLLLGNGNDAVVANGNQDIVVGGNGSDNVTAGGNQLFLLLGNGNNTVVANGSGLNGAPPEQIIVGNGNNTVTANGSGTGSADGTQLTAGSGSNTITANGNWAQISVGARGASPPNGSLMLSATGGDDTITVNASAGSSDAMLLGSNATVSVTGGTLTASALTGGGDAFYLNGINAGSAISEGGNNNQTFLGSDSSAVVHLGAAATGDVVTVQASTSHHYAGTVEISGFAAGNQVDLQGLVGGITDLAFTGSGAALLAQVLANMTHDAGGDTLHLVGDGAIRFDTPGTAYMASSFLATGNTGPVVG